MKLINYKSLSAIFLVLLVAFVLITHSLFGNRLDTEASNEVYMPPRRINHKSASLEEFELEIPKLGLTIPVIKNVNGADKSAYNKALLSGVAHYEGTALPGEGSNTFIFGHSSSEIGSGEYGEIFKDINVLNERDRITVVYDGIIRNYIVIEKRVVEKTEVEVLDPTNEEQITLMTCWPIGTNLKRLIVIAKPRTL